MRVKDDRKQEALFLATIKLVNKIGFAASSVSKIAKEAGVSPATLYVYYQNKEDLLVSTYLEIKRDMGAVTLTDMDESAPVRDILHRVWRNMFAYVAENTEEFKFTEQFSYSPYSQLVDKDEVQQNFLPVIRTVQRGIEEKIIKDVNLDILGAFLFFPIFKLANTDLCRRVELNEETIDTAFGLAWDAVKL